MFEDMAGIIMRGTAGQLWAAYLDDPVVRYFTTEPQFKDKLPATIENWLSSKNKDVVFHSDVRRVPTSFPQR